jgi:hypothetical protein
MSRVSTRASSRERPLLVAIDLLTAGAALGGVDS